MIILFLTYFFFFLIVSTENEMENFNYLEIFKEKLNLMRAETRFAIYSNLNMGEIVSEGLSSNNCSCLIDSNNYLIRVYNNKSIKQKIDDFFNDLQVIRNIEHTNIIEFKGVYFNESKFNFGIVLESLPKTLNDLINSEGELLDDERHYISKQIIQALIYIHSLKISFANLNSHFIFMDESLEIIRLMQPDMNLQAEFKSSHRYLNFSIFLKLLEQKYTPPELIMNEYDFFHQRYFHDVWRFGILLFEIFSNSENGLKLSMPWLLDEDLEGKKNTIKYIEKNGFYLNTNKFVIYQGEKNDGIADLINSILQIKFDLRPPALDILDRLLILKLD